MTSKVVLTNVQVLAAGTRIEQDQEKGKPMPVTVVTLLVDPEQAERLTLASTEGKIQLALRNPLDQGAPETPGIKPAGLLGIAQAPAPRADRDARHGRARRRPVTQTVPRRAAAADRRNHPRRQARDRSDPSRTELNRTLTRSDPDDRTGHEHPVDAPAMIEASSRARPCFIIVILVADAAGAAAGAFSAVVRRACSAGAAARRRPSADRRRPAGRPLDDPERRRRRSPACR